jgi:hypothetical protein
MMIPGVAVAVRCLLAALAALLVLLGGGVWASLLVPIATADPEPCAAEKAAVDADREAILEHNSRKAPRPVPPSVGIPYNQEAAALRAKGNADRAEPRSCAVAKLTDNGRPLIGLTERVRDAINQARRPGWQPPNTLATNPINKGVVVPQNSSPRPLYDVLRAASPGPVKNFPNVPLRGQARPSPGDVSKAVKGRVIGKTNDGRPYVSPDHIVPLAEVVQLPRFMELDADNIWLICERAV